PRLSHPLPLSSCFSFFLLLFSSILFPRYRDHRDLHSFPTRRSSDLGAHRNRLSEENLPALVARMENLAKHIESIDYFGLPFVVVINKFPTDTPSEIAFIHSCSEKLVYSVDLTDVWAKGGEGGIELAEKVLEKAQSSHNAFKRVYNLDDTLETKIKKVAQIIYGAKGIELSTKAKKQIAFFERQ